MTCSRLFRYTAGSQGPRRVALDSTFRTQLQQWQPVTLFFYPGAAPADVHHGIPSGDVKIANGHIDIVSFPIQSDDVQ